MPRSLVKYAWRCLEVILEVTNNQKKITYQDLADRLGLQLAKQEWQSWQRHRPDADCRLHKWSGEGPRALF